MEKDHYECKVSLDGTCSHISAILFYIEAAEKIRRTEELSYMMGEDDEEKSGQRRFGLTASDRVI